MYLWDNVGLFNIHQTVKPSPTVNRTVWLKLWSIFSRISIMWLNFMIRCCMEWFWSFQKYLVPLLKGLKWLSSTAHKCALPQTVSLVKWDSKNRTTGFPFFWLYLLKPTGHVMHQQSNIQQLYVLPTLYLCVLYLPENKQRLVPLTA